MRGDPAGLAPLRLPNGMDVFQLCPSNTMIAFDEIFRDRIYVPIVESLDDEAVVLDVGANIGLFTLFLNQLGKKLTVHCFEPIPRTFEALKKNIAAHDRLGATLHNAGAADRDGFTQFTFYPKTSTSSSMYPDESPEAHSESNAYIASEMHRITRGWTRMLPRWAIGAIAERIRRNFQRSERVTCRLRRISDVIREAGLKRIDLMKIDVEGAEFDCVRGIDEDHWPLVKRVIIEIHGGEDDKDRMEKLLAERGLAIRRTFQQSPEIFSRHYLIEAVREAS